MTTGKAKALLLCAVALVAAGNYVINDPVIESHGFMFTETTGEERELKSIVQRAVNNYDYASGNKDELAAHVRKSLKNYFYKTTKQSPLIIVSVLDV